MLPGKPRVQPRVARFLDCPGFFSELKRWKTDLVVAKTLEKNKIDHAKTRHVAVLSFAVPRGHITLTEFSREPYGTTDFRFMLSWAAASPLKFITHFTDSIARYERII
jgi:hypothetical protein